MVFKQLSKQQNIVKLWSQSQQTKANCDFFNEKINETHTALEKNRKITNEKYNWYLKVKASVSFKKIKQKK